MSDLTQPIEVEFFDGQRKTFRVTRSLRQWLIRERDFWNDFFVNSKHNFNNALSDSASIVNTLIVWADTIANDPVTITNNLMQTITSHYGGPTPKLVHSRSALATKIIEIEQQSREGAEFAYALATGRNPGPPNSIEQMRGALSVSIPEIVKGSSLARMLERERTQFLTDTETLLAEESEILSDQRGEAKHWLSDMRSRFKRDRRWAVAYARRRRDAELLKVYKAVNDMDLIRRQYDEFMHLDAAVRYWDRKARSHKDIGRARLRNITKLAAWSVAGLTTLYVFFGLVILELSGLDVPILALATAPGRTIPVGFYVSIAVTLGIVSTVVLWSARILVRLYLSEHHLAQDAAERSVMTKTYLALIKDKGAEPNERLVVLNSLFRTRTDGVIADGSPGEVSGLALLAQLLDRGTGPKTQ